MVLGVLEMQTNRAVAPILVGIASTCLFSASCREAEPPRVVAPVNMETKINPSDGLSYVRIPAGQFEMGCSQKDEECRPSEKPAHLVTLTRDFWIGQTEVTVGAYKQFAEATGTSIAETSGWGSMLRLKAYFAGNTHPVGNLDWHDAAAYCRWAGGRLPSEAEWEYAARAGSADARYGDIDEIAQTWCSFCSENPGYARPVAEKKPNAFGLYDTLGNMEEWVFDWYGEYGADPQQDPNGPVSGTGRMHRGGAWAYASTPRVSERSRSAYQRTMSTGVRCALN